MLCYATVDLESGSIFHNCADRSKVLNHLSHGHPVSLHFRLVAQIPQPEPHSLSTALTSFGGSGWEQKPAGLPFPPRAAWPGTWRAVPCSMLHRSTMEAPLTKPHPTVALCPWQTLGMGHSAGGQEAELFLHPCLPVPPPGRASCQRTKCAIVNFIGQNCFTDVFYLSFMGCIFLLFL